MGNKNTECRILILLEHFRGLLNRQVKLKGGEEREQNKMSLNFISRKRVAIKY